MAEKDAYCQAVKTGMYEKPTGLRGKYDNVRRFWEDEVTARQMSPAISALVDPQSNRRGPIRILDMGCGSGDGFELLTRVPSVNTRSDNVSCAALRPDAIARYVGVDINEDLISQAQSCHGGNANTAFIQGDLTDGLPEEIVGQEPFDLYFAGYGTLSHFHDDQSAVIIADVCRHAADRAIFVGDWLGRYSYEWQDLWHHPVDREYFMDYRISYIYPQEERNNIEVTSFPLRLMTAREIMTVVEEAQAKSGARLKPLAFFDRSIFVGRHMETGDYSGHCSDTRNAVNSLLEPSLRTDLSRLVVNYVAREGFGELNTFFESFFAACNRLVRYTQALLEGDRSAEALRNESMETVRGAQDAIRRVVESTALFDWCDARANFVEPLLAYCLRQLETDMQPGLGYGHGLVGVFEIIK